MVNGIGPDATTTTTTRAGGVPQPTTTTSVSDLESRLDVESQIRSAISEFRDILANRLPETEEDTQIFSFVRRLLRCHLSLLDDSAILSCHSLLRSVLSRIFSKYLHVRDISDSSSSSSSQVVGGQFVEVLVRVLDPGQVMYIAKPRQLPKREDVIVEDFPETEESSTSPYAMSATPGSWLSDQFIDNWNFFDSLGGFVALFSRLSSASLSPLSDVSAVLGMIHSVQDRYLPKRGVLAFAQISREVVLPRISNVVNEDPRSFKKDQLDRIFVLLEQLFEAAYPPLQCGEILEPVYLDVALQCFRSKLFDKRLHGISCLAFMATWIRNAERMMTSMVGMTLAVTTSMETRVAKFYTAKTYGEWLVRANLVEELFGSSTHVQVLKRAGTLLNFLARERVLSEEHLALIWGTCAHAHESVSTALLTLLSGECFAFPSEYVEFFVQSLKALPRSELRPAIVGFAATLAVKALESGHRTAMLQHLWALVIETPGSENGPSAEISSLALNRACEIFRSPAFYHNRAEWLTLVCATAKDSSCAEAVPRCYEALEALLSTFPQVATTLDPDSVYQVTRSLQERFFLVSHVFAEVASFHETSSGPSTVAGVASRLRFLDFLLRRYDQPINSDLFEELWASLVARASCQGVADAFFSWVVQCRTPQQGRRLALADDTARALFGQVIQNVQLVSRSEVAFRCFRMLMLDANTFACRMSLSPTGELLKVLGAPEDLLGYRELWDLALSSDDSLAADLLLELFSKVESPDRRSGFLEEVMESLELARGKRPVTLRCLELLQKQVALLEGDPEVTKLKRHGSLGRGRALTLSVRVPSGEETKMVVHTDDSLESLLSRVRTMQLESVGDKSVFDLSQLVLRIRGGPRMSGTEELKTTVAASGLCDGDHVQVEAPDSLVGKTAFFRTRHNDSAYERKPPDWESSIRQVMQFGGPGVSEVLALVTLRRCNWYVQSALALLLDDMQRATMQVEADESPEGQAAAAEKLRTERAAGGISLSSRMTLEMFTEISANQRYFNLLFSLLELEDAEVTSQVWGLLMRVQTSEQMLKRVRAADNLQELLDPSAPFKLLYTLQILDSLVDIRVQGSVPLRKSLSASASGLGIEQDAEAAIWRDRFGAGEAFRHLLESVVPALSDLHCDGVALAVRKQCLMHALKIVDALFFKPKPPPAHLAELLLKSVLEQMASAFDSPAGATPLCDEKDGNLVAYVMHLIVQAASCDRKVGEAVVSRFLEDDGKLLRSFVLLCPFSSVRQEVAVGVYRLSGVLQTCAKAMLQSLLTMMPPAETSDPRQWSTCGDYFGLLCRLMEGTESPIPEDQGGSSLLELAKRLQARPVLETGDGSGPSDSLLCGLLRLLRVVLHRSARQTKEELGRELVRELQHGCLFSAPGSDAMQASKPKCQCAVTRAAACDLLVELCTDCEPNFAVLLELILAQHQLSPADDAAAPQTPGSPAPHGQAKPTKAAKITWDYLPSSERKPACGFSGLVNQGNTCYQNSLLQQLYHIDIVRRAVLEVDPQLMGGTGPVRQLVVTLQELFGAMQETERCAANTASLHAAYKSSARDADNVNRQQDVEEFWNFLWQRMEESLKGTQQWKALQAVFEGKICYEIRSVDKDRPYVSRREEEFHVLPLDVKGKKSVEEALDLYVAHDKLEGDNALSCEEYNNAKVDATRRASLSGLPPVLVLLLKRFEFDYNTNQKLKINDSVSFPTSLDMRPWTPEGLAQREHTSSATPERPAAYYAYRLKGIIVHTGGAEAGHYYSYVRADSKGGAWFEFNDDKVKPFDTRNLDKDCFGGRQTVSHLDYWRRQVRSEFDKVHNAYVLFYERELVEGLDDPALFSSPCGTPLQAVVPASIAQAIREDNARFVRDTQFFDETYFEFLLRFIAIPHEDDQSLLCKKVRLETSFFLGVLSRAKLGDLVVGKWARQLQSDLVSCEAALSWFLSHVSQGNTLREILLDCPNERVRVVFAELLAAAMKAAAPTDSAGWEAEETPAGKTSPQPVSVAVRCFNKLFDLLEVSRTSWRRFKQYFRVIRDFALIGPFARRHLLRRDLVALYADYFMGRERNKGIPRPQVMDDETLPDLSEFVDTVTVLCRGCFQGQAAEGVTPLSLTPHSDLFQPPLNLLTPLFSEHFFARYLEMDYNPTSMAQMIQHLSWEDPYRSNMIMDTILKQYAVENSKQSAWDKLLAEMIAVPDSLQKFRVQAGLGLFTLRGSAAGLLALVHQLSPEFPKTLSHVKLLVRICKKLPVAAEFVARQQSEMTWLVQFAESKIATAVRPESLKAVYEYVDRLSEVDNDEAAVDVVADDAWRGSKFVSLLIDIKRMARMHSSAGIDGAREKELLDHISQLHDALFHYVMHAPHVQQPGYLASPEWRRFMESKTPVVVVNKATLYGSNDGFYADEDDPEPANIAQYVAGGPAKPRAGGDMPARSPDNDSTEAETGSVVNTAAGDLCDTDVDEDCMLARERRDRGVQGCATAPSGTGNAASVSKRQKMGSSGDMDCVVDSFENRKPVTQAATILNGPAPPPPIVIPPPEQPAPLNLSQLNAYHKDKMEQVQEFTQVSPEEALRLLQQNFWEVQQAISSYYADARM